MNSASRDAFIAVRNLFRDRLQAIADGVSGLILQFHMKYRRRFCKVDYFQIRQDYLWSSTQNVYL